ncbi:MAG TPA: PilW family protein [Burkholderiales bacterium]|nr:PilW family protein [Burkholderiales bacterium]
MTHRIKQLGVSLIELMVAMAIGLVVMLVVFQLFSVSEGTRRTSIAGSDAQMSAAIAVTALQDQIRNGGYGLVDRFRDLANTPFSALGCNVVGTDVRTGTPVGVAFPLAPVVIAAGAGATASDTITITYADLPYPTVPTPLMQSMATTTDPSILVNNRYGIRPGDVLVLAQADPTPPGNVVACRLIEATGTPTNPPNPDPNANSMVQRGTAPYLIGTTLTSVRFNGATGISPLPFTPSQALTTDGAVYNLGRGPSVVQFALADMSPVDTIAETLTMAQLLGSSTAAGATQPQQLVEGIVAFRAQYGVGVDTTAPADGIADQFNPAVATVNQAAAPGQSAWQNPTSAANPCPPLAVGGPTGCQWGLILAVRFAVLARSNLIERKDPVTNTCTATPATSPELTWAGGTFDVSNIPDWQCYRYKRFEAVVPLRNMIWMPT